MSTASLIRWIALVAGAELTVRGHLAGRFWTCHAGAALFAIALAAIARPTRARRAGAVAAAVLFAIAAIDAAIGVFGAPAPAAAVREPTAPAPAESAVAPSAPSLPGRFAILVFAGRDADGQSPLPASLLRARVAELACDPPIDVVERVTREPLGDSATLAAALARFHPGLVLVIAANAVLDEVIAELPALDFPAPEPIGPRGSAIGRVLERAISEWRRERAWRGALGTELALDPRSSRVVARYRELVLASRRADAEVVLLIPPLAASADTDRIRAAETAAPRARAWLLASRAHARSLRALAGSYGISAIDTRPDVEATGGASFDDPAHLSAAGRERFAQAVASALAERLARAVPGCTKR
ncbi:MAG TPA: hypothetical protein VKH41_00105 [Myxococcota bacterium]|nr:hypothetical protein [Myxococcota bacterium]